MLGTAHRQLVGRGRISRNAGCLRKQKISLVARSPTPQYERYCEEYYCVPTTAMLCRDAFQGSRLKHQREPSESLREIIRVSPNTRVFLTGRPYIADELVRCFSEAVKLLTYSVHPSVLRWGCTVALILMQGMTNFGYVVLLWESLGNVSQNIECCIFFRVVNWIVTFWMWAIIPFLQSNTIFTSLLS